MNRPALIAPHVPGRSLRSKSGHLLLELDAARPGAFTGLGLTVLVLIIGVFIAARLWRLDAFDLWADEITTLEAIRLDWNGLLGFIKADVVHPPLFYLLLKLWVHIGGESAWWLRLFPALTAIATIVPFYLLCWELKLPARVIGLALLLASVNGYLIHYAQELRMYSLLLFLSVCSLWRFVRFFNFVSWGNFAALFVVNLLLVYTHYFGWLVVAVEGIYVIYRRGRPCYWFALSAALLLLCFSPWLYVVNQAATQKGGLSSNLSWMRHPGLLDLIWPYAILNGPLPWDWPARASMLGILLFGYPILLWMLPSFRTHGDDLEERSTYWWLLLLCGFPVAVAWLASQVLPHPVWHPRYFIIVAAPYFILVAAAVSRLRPFWLSAITTLLVVSWAVLSGIRDLQNTERVAWQSLFRRMTLAEASSPKPVTVYTIGSQGIQFYFDEVEEKRFKVIRWRDRQVDSVLPRFWISFRSAADHYRVPFFEAARWEKQKLKALEVRLTAMGYQVGQGFETGAAGYRHILFPVSRSAAGARRWSRAVR
jgi:uncharacterized membrane protein